MVIVFPSIRTGFGNGKSTGFKEISPDFRRKGTYLVMTFCKSRVKKWLRSGFQRGNGCFGSYFIKDQGCVAWLMLDFECLIAFSQKRIGSFVGSAKLFYWCWISIPGII